MKTLALLIILALALPVRADAYTLRYRNDNLTVVVLCEDGTVADTFDWNGDRWTNGTVWGEDIRVLAEAAVKARGDSCH